MIRSYVYRIPRAVNNVRCYCYKYLHHDSIDRYQAWVRTPLVSSPSSTSRLKLEHPALRGISSPHEVLIRVEAASVNPMDVRMAEGYGDTILGLYRLVDSSLKLQPPPPSPSTLGRDFSGVVEAVGQSVVGFKPGDEVYGALKPIVEGSHAEYTLADAHCISLKPKNLSHVEAASIPYVALTFLSAVDPFYDIGPMTYDLGSKRVFVNGGAGGIATFAVQFLKYLNCEVTVSVSDAGREIVEKLNPDHIVNYQSPSFIEDLQKHAGFDLVFDCVNDESALPFLKPGGKFVTVVTPLLSGADQLGLLPGSISSFLKLAQKVQSTYVNYGAIYNWGYFMPSGSRLNHIQAMLEDEKIVPVIDEVFSFDDLPAAYDKVGKGKSRGKTVIKVR